MNNSNDNNGLTEGLLANSAEEPLPQRQGAPMISSSPGDYKYPSMEDSGIGVMESQVIDSSNALGSTQDFGTDDSNINNNNNNNDNNVTLQVGHGLRGEAQNSDTYRDAPFAVGFILHLIVMLYFAVFWGFGALFGDSSSNDNDINNLDYATDDNWNPDNKSADSGIDDEAATFRAGGFILICLVACVVSIGASSLALKLMTVYAEQLIQASLIGCCAVLGLLSIFLFLTGGVVIGVFGLILLAIYSWYAYVVWPRIPFAASNLRAGITAIQDNSGVCMIAYGIAFVANFWVLIWGLASIGVNSKSPTSCDVDADGTKQCTSNMNAAVAFLLILSYFWTSQVLKNVLQVTIAGVVGTWWFAPQEANSVYSPAIQDSFHRATTTSFGSICMGSLLVAIIQTLHQMVHAAKRNRRLNGMLLCVLECLVYYLDLMSNYFNKWAFIYVGLYGYDYITAGKKVFGLFQERGWTAIVNDSLVSRVLFLVSLVLGAITGLVGMLLSDLFLGRDTGGGAFIICFIIGWSLSLIILGVVMSAVDTVVVSFAEAPAEFETNHPALSQNMISAWRAVYPEECGF